MERLRSCVHCRIDKKVFATVESWYDHLLSAGHATIKRKLQAFDMLKWNPGRSLALKQILNVKSTDILGYFGSFGEIEDFSYPSKTDGKTNYAYILMEDESAIRSILGCSGHQIWSIGISVSPARAKPVFEATKPSKKGKDGPGLFVELYGKPEGGQITTTGKDLFVCRICQMTEATGLSSSAEWFQHLMSVPHQKIHRQYQLLRKILWDQQRTILIKNVAGIGQYDILQFLFESRVPIVDFSYLSEIPGKTNACYALIATVPATREFYAARPHIIPGAKPRKIKIQRIEKIQKKKWFKWKEKLLSKANVPLMESDLEAKSFLNKISEVSGSAAASTTPSSRKRNLEQTSQLKFESLKNLPVDEQLERLQSEIGWSEEYLNNSIQFIDSSLGTLNIKYKKYPFGNLITGMGLFSRPLLEVLVDVEEMFTNDADLSKVEISKMVEDQRKALSYLETSGGLFNIRLRNSDELCYNGVVAGNPIQTELRLKFATMLPLQDCKLFKLYCDLDVRVELLARVLTFWADVLKIFDNASEEYSSQCVLYLLMFFLQNKKVVPSLKTLQEMGSNGNPPKTIFGHNVSFCSDLNKVKPNKLGMLEDKSIRAMSVLGLLQDWFQFFANVDFQTVAICIRSGSLIVEKKEAMQNMCIINPFDGKSDCTQNIGLEEVVNFQKQCRSAAETVSSILTSDKPDLTVFLESICTFSGGLDSRRNKMVKMDGGHQPGQPLPTDSILQTHEENYDDDDDNYAPEEECEGEEQDDDEHSSNLAAESTLTQNLNTFLYFERAFTGDQNMKFQKLQILILQYIAEYNQRFWTNCLGLNYEPKEMFTIEDFAKLYYNGQQKGPKSNEERISAISDEMSFIDVTFRVSTNGNFLHKIFLEPISSLTKKNWAAGPRLTEFSLLLNQEVPQSRLDEIKSSVFTPNSEKLTFSCTLTGAIDRVFKEIVPLGTLNISPVGNDSEHSLAVISILKTIYKRVGMTYITKMVKKWLSEGSDFNEEKAANFIRNRNRRWRGNGKKNWKNKAKSFQKKRQQQRRQRQGQT